ncbi:hypothetical protein IQ238_01720 [Pleurocapsales cyanobacterium LEGE 06147]|nr:hypothetical protein [Pleurocapsales cyanobacterium LEGE 06147]
MTARRTRQLTAIFPKRQERDKSGAAALAKRDRLQKRLERSLNFLSDLLGELSDLEVNTTIVEEIVEEQVIPWEIYQAIYPISQSYLEQLNIHPSLRDRYLNLRRQLELEYILLLSNPNSDLYNPPLAAHLNRNLSLLAQPNSDWEAIPTSLPQPSSAENSEAVSAVQQLLHDYYFLRVLRRLGNVKMALDKRNKYLCQLESELSPLHDKIIEVKEITYAQTLIGLDGKIVNRYCQDLLTHPHKDLILAIHKKGVRLGEQQWRGLLEFILNIFQTEKRIKNS